MENHTTPPPPYELKLEHTLKHQPEAKDFIIDVDGTIFRKGSSSPLEEIFFSSKVDDFIWEDEDCPEKVELYEILVDAGVDEYEANILLINTIRYVCDNSPPDDEDYKGVFTLTMEVTLPPEPVELNHAGSEQTQSQEPIATTTTKTSEQQRHWLKPKPKIQKARYKIGADGASLVLSELEPCDQ
ncbi:unnamed protein product [Thlaspi arvense]|uniref:Uncharacterized protein n=1 Tax=Thlaspi arvense TaxID=13288 RepID=A0AAU9RIU7_THLAR|nr:unnamed protein product [Thlaspi arvense]